MSTSSVNAWSVLITFFPFLGVSLFLSNFGFWFFNCFLWQIIFIDLILHRPKVYRHVLYNAINPATVNIQVKNYFNSSS